LEWRNRGLILIRSKVARTEGHQSIQPEQIYYAGRCAATRKNVMKEMSQLRRIEKLTINRIHSISKVQ
jgi:hypothetical protein